MIQTRGNSTKLQAKWTAVMMGTCAIEHSVGLEGFMSTTSLMPNCPGCWAMLEDFFAVAPLISIPTRCDRADVLLGNLCRSKGQGRGLDLPVTTC